MDCREVEYVFDNLSDEDRRILFLTDKQGNFVLNKRGEPVERIWTAMHLVLFSGRYDLEDPDSDKNQATFAQRIINAWVMFSGEYTHCEISFLSIPKNRKKYTTLRIACRIVANHPNVAIVPDKTMSKEGYKHKKIIANENEIKQVLIFSLFQRGKPFNSFVILKMGAPWLLGDPASDFEKRRIEKETKEGKEIDVSLSAYTCTTLAACSLAVINRWKNFTIPGSGGVQGLYAWDLTPSNLKRVLKHAGCLEEDIEFAWRNEELIRRLPQISQ